MVGRVLRKSFVQPPARAELLLTLDQVSYGFAWASPEKLQGQRLHSLAGWINPSSTALPPHHFYDFFFLMSSTNLPNYSLWLLPPFLPSAITKKSLSPLPL